MADHDVLSIINTINLYVLAVDMQRWDLFDRIFTQDVDADFGASSHWPESSRVQGGLRRVLEPLRQHAARDDESLW